MDFPEVNMKLLGELEEMGFPLARAMRALHYSGLFIGYFFVAGSFYKVLPCIGLGQ